MNRNIMNIAEKTSKRVPLHSREFIEEFALALLHRCIEICENGENTQLTSQGAAQEIKSHFGIKDKK